MARVTQGFRSKEASFFWYANLTTPRTRHPLPAQADPSASRTISPPPEKREAAAAAAAVGALVSRAGRCKRGDGTQIIRDNPNMVRNGSAPTRIQYGTGYICLNFVTACFVSTGRVSGK